LLGRIDGADHVVEHLVEGVVVYVAQCVDSPIHDRRDDA
jgi:hypothetical protein